MMPMLLSTRCLPAPSHMRYGPTPLQYPVVFEKRAKNAGSQTLDLLSDLQECCCQECSPPCCLLRTVIQVAFLASACRPRPFAMHPRMAETSKACQGNRPAFKACFFSYHHFIGALPLLLPASARCWLSRAEFRCMLQNVGWAGRYIGG